MAKNSVKEWSKTAASNTDVGGIGITGSSSLASGNDAMQEIMEQIATQFGLINAKGADIASATTTDLATATGNAVDITGTTTITGLGTVDAGQVFVLQFDGILTLTHNATSLKLPGGVNIKTAAGDIAVVISEGSGNWRCVSYQRAARICFSAHKNGTAQTGLSNGQVTFGTELFDVGGFYDAGTSTFTPPAGKYRLSAKVLSTANIADQSGYTIAIQQDGTGIATTVVRASGTGSITIVAQGLVVANGSNAYTVLYTSGSGTSTIDGSTAFSTFEGEEI